MTLVIASRNPNKIGELRSILSDLDIEIKASPEFPELSEVEEDADTLEENALKKARYTWRHTGYASLADDTGLEVNALDGEPGVRSARYAGPDAGYEDNTRKLLEELAKTGSPDRSARFRTVVAFIVGSLEHTFEGICRGRILEEPKGNKGFGYDPVFQPEGYKQTFAELDEDEKNRISHRGRAIEKFYHWIRENLDVLEEQ